MVNPERCRQDHMVNPERCRQDLILDVRKECLSTASKMNNNEDCTVTATVDVRQAQIHPSTLWTPTKVAERHSRPDHTLTRNRSPLIPITS